MAQLAQKKCLFGILILSFVLGGVSVSFADDKSFKETARDAAVGSSAATLRRPSVQEMRAIQLDEITASHSTVPTVFQTVLKADPTSVYLENFKARLIVDNLESLYWKIKAIEGSIEIGMNTFEWEDGVSGKALAYAIAKKALEFRDPAQLSGQPFLQKGDVPRFTVLVDAYKIQSKGQFQMLAAMSRAGVSVKLYRPTRDRRLPGFLQHLPSVLSEPIKSWNRMHDKALWTKTPDGNVVLISGGRNASDHYLLGDDVFDVDVRLDLSARNGQEVFRRQIEPFLRLPIVQSFYPEEYSELKGFDDMSFGVEMNRLKESYELVQSFFDTDYFRGRLDENRASSSKEFSVPHGVYLRNFGKRRPSLTKAVESLIQQATKTITIANAYFIPHEGFNGMLKDKLKKRVKNNESPSEMAEVDIAVYTNSFKSTQHTNVIHLMESMVSDLLPLGLDLYLSQEGEVHAKTTAVDGRYVVVGAANLDPRSSGAADPRHTNRDTQNGVLLDSPEIAAQFESTVEARKERGGFKYIHKFPGFHPINACIRALLSPIKGWF